MCARPAAVLFRADGSGPSGRNRRPGCGRAVPGRGRRRARMCASSRRRAGKGWKTGRGAGGLAGLGARVSGTRGDFLRAQQGRAQGAKGAGGVRRGGKVGSHGADATTGAIAVKGLRSGATVRRRRARERTRRRGRQGCSVRQLDVAVLAMRWRSSSSRLIRAAYSAGVLPSTSEPPSARRWAIFGSFSTLTAAAWMRSTTACGCPPARPGHTRPCCPSAAGRLPRSSARPAARAGAWAPRSPGAQLAGLDMGHGRGQVVELRVDLAGDHVVQRRARAAVGHVHHVGIGQRLEQLAVQVADAAGAGRGIAVLAGCS